MSVEDSNTIKEEFWNDFEAALAPSKATKQEYLEALQDLVSDASMRIEAVRDEIANDEDGAPEVAEEEVSS